MMKLPMHQKIFAMISNYCNTKLSEAKIVALNKSKV